MDSLVIEIPAELFAPAESSSYAGELAISSFEFGPDEYRAARPLSWNAAITNVGGALLVSGTVKGQVTTACARCLEDATFDVEGEIEGYFLIEGEGEAPDDMEEDEFDVLPEDNKLDLEPLILAAVYVELPLIPLCREDCKGICPTCGANLNEGPCDCVPDAPDEDDGFNPNNPFAALKGLKLD